MEQSQKLSGVGSVTRRLRQRMGRLLTTEPAGGRHGGNYHVNMLEEYAAVAPNRLLDTLGFDVDVGSDEPKHPAGPALLFLARRQADAIGTS